MKPFNLQQFPLTGRQLIEASAGTGKTYNIANIYLRLLLGEGCDARTVEQILVVTFTRAATDELRGRIRARVAEELQHRRQQAGSTEDNNENTAACRRLDNALVRMDEACIFTIHGFAVRAIQSFLFETGALANVELSEGENPRRDLVIADLWRQLKLTPDPALQRYADALGFADRDKFAKYFSTVNGDAAVLPAFNISRSSTLESLLPQLEPLLLARIRPLQEQRRKLRDQWRKLHDSMGVDNVKAAYGDKGNSSVMKKVDEFMASDGLLLEYKTDAVWYQRLMAVANANDAVADIRDFSRQLLQHLEHGIDEDMVRRNLFLSLLLQFIQHKLQEIDLSAMQLNEVITLVNRTLANARQADRLRRVITETWPVCLVDEFQDTDPAQFELFDSLYANTEGTGFFMIGDPKQSIYQFRGADIFSYLRVKQQVGETWALDTNFRSKQALVDATNMLFAEKDADSVFYYPGIRYEAVQSCERVAGKHKGELQDDTAAALVFIGNPAADKLDANTLRWKYARDTAERIAHLLATATIRTEKETGLRRMRGSDIAVLVRSGREASAVRQALLALDTPIGSVYQSQKDSVFTSSAIAEDLYHILGAMDDPKDKTRLKLAMATLFYRGFDNAFAELDALEADDDKGDSAFEQLIDTFEQYRAAWEEHGVLSALAALVQQRALLPKLAALPDGDRLITDFRHLGELLQHKELECSSREQLIAWYSRQLHGDRDVDEDSRRIRLESDENLVKIVTIHVSKGLEYPVVFVPFFFMPWQADTDKQPPLLHPAAQHYRGVVDYTLPATDAEQQMQREMRAEDMRLLYVAITRAVFRCYLGISAAVTGRNKRPSFPQTAWQHLLGINSPVPAWDEICSALQQKFSQQQNAISCRQLFDTRAATPVRTSQEKPAPVPLLEKIEVPKLQESRWVITSYTALASTHQQGATRAHNAPAPRRGGADELPATTTSSNDNNDEDTQDNIRFRLRGSARTGDCLHELFEQLARNPEQYLQQAGGFDELLQSLLRKHGLEKPEQFDALQQPVDSATREAIYRQRRQDLSDWLGCVLDKPLLHEANTPDVNTPVANTRGSALRELFLAGTALPELAFDFSLGVGEAVPVAAINAVLQGQGMEGIAVPNRQALEGLVTGSIDLLFLHNKKFYLLDYKSNTLGKQRSAYNRDAMARAMREQRYDLQYLLYTVAAHRYAQQRLGPRYGFDHGEYSFGGVIYLFLRGVFADAPDTGVWFHRPSAQLVAQLDSLLAGRVLAGRRAT